MKITLELVRSTLRNGLGSDSFIASFISSVEESTTCPTACINSEGKLQYHPDFITKHVSTGQDLFCLVLHEVMHPMFGHFVYGGGQLENVAADCVINASISMLFAGPSGDGSLFTEFYKGEGLEGLLRPDSKMGLSRYSRLYSVFYGDTSRDSWLTTGEVIQTLKVLTPEKEADEVELLGNHGGGSDGNGAGNGGQTGSNNGSTDMSSETLSRIADELRRKARLGGGLPGYGQNLMDMFMAIVKSHITLKRTLLERWLTTRKLDGFRKPERRPRVQVSPIPLRPSKRDLVLLSSGITPFHYHQTATAIESKKHGLAVYLDVSGSVNSHLPAILGLLSDLADDLTSIFLFSNAVVETSFKAVLKGAIMTTYGTDFNCVVESILAKGFDKAIVLTDGYAGIKAELLEEAKKKRGRVLTVLFGGKQDCPELAPLGDVVRLEEVTSERRR